MSDISRRGLLRGAAGLSVAGGVILGTGEGAAGAAPRSSGVREVDVVVVGAGLAGLTTARELKLHGHSVLVLEARW
jgi:monoamine oxidase